MLIGHCVMGKHAERKRLSFNDFCRGSRSAEEEKTDRCRSTVFGSPFLVSLTKLSSIDIRVVFQRAFDGQPLR